jgi:hypothetical protein
MRIDGTLRFPPLGRQLDVQRVRVSVRDTTELDAPAQEVAALDLPAVHIPETGLDLPFTIDAALDDPRRTYTVRAHADRNGSGTVDVGDLVTTTSHVVRQEDAESLVLPLEPVGTIE